MVISFGVGLTFLTGQLTDSLFSHVCSKSGAALAAGSAAEREIGRAKGISRISLCLLGICCFKS